MGDYRTRPNDHLVEPFLGGLRPADSPEGDADADPAAGGAPQHGAAPEGSEPRSDGGWRRGLAALLRRLGRS